MINEYLDTAAYGVLITEGTEFQNIYSNSFMGGIAGVDTYNHRYTAQLNMYLTARSAANANRYFTRITIKGKTGQESFHVLRRILYEFWKPEYTRGLDIPDGAGSNSNMAFWTEHPRSRKLRVSKYYRFGISGRNNRRHKLFLILWRDARWQDNA